MDETPVQPAFVNRTAVVLIVTICLCIVFIPSIVSYIPVERSKWLVAKAQNILNLSKNVDEGVKQQARDLLNQAEKLNPAIANSMDYMTIYASVNDDSIDYMSKLIAKLDYDMQLVALDQWIKRLFKEQNPQAVIEVIEKVLPDKDLWTPNLHNSFAYAASLANVRLEEAEAAIEEALKLEGELDAYLDTKAWVLHKLMRNEQALPIIQQAIQKDFQSWHLSLDSPLLELDKVSKSLKDYVSAVEKSDPLAKVSPEQLMAELRLLQSDDVPAEDQERIKSLKDAWKDLQVPTYHGPVDSGKILELLQSLMTLRYHRSEIIRAIGFTETADLEWKAIEAMGFSDPNQLQ